MEPEPHRGGRPAERQPVRLQTERLVLDMPHPQEAQKVIDYFWRNRDHLEPWEPPRPPGFYTTVFWAARLDLNRRELAEDRSMRLFLRPRSDTGRVVGSCSFNHIMRGAFQACHLGYGIDGECEGQGLMAEALSAAIGYAFEHLQLHRVQANYQPDNERSGRLLDRLGFVREGYARDYLFIDGAWRDHVLTSLTNPDLPAPAR